MKVNTDGPMETSTEVFNFYYDYINMNINLYNIKEHLSMMKDTVKVYLLTAWVNRLNKYMIMEIFYDEIHLRKYLFYENNL